MVPFNLLYPIPGMFTIFKIISRTKYITKYSHSLYISQKPWRIGIKVDRDYRKTTAGIWAQVGLKVPSTMKCRQRSQVYTQKSRTKMIIGPHIYFSGPQRRPTNSNTWGGDTYGIFTFREGSPPLDKTNRATLPKTENLPKKTQEPEKRGRAVACRCVTLNVARQKHHLRDNGSECQRGKEEGSVHLRLHPIPGSAAQDPLSRFWPKQLGIEEQNRLWSLWVNDP